MSKIRLLLPLVALAVPLLSSLPGRAELALFPPRERAPEVAFLDRAGDYRGLVEYQGRPVILLFWASWCPICLGEVPKLDRLRARLAQDRLAVLALSQDRTGFTAVDRFYRRHGIRHLAKYLDEEGILAAFMGVRGVPTTFILNGRGELVGAAEGAVDWDSQALVQRVLAHAGR